MIRIRTAAVVALAVAGTVLAAAPPASTRISGFAGSLAATSSMRRFKSSALSW